MGKDRKNLKINKSSGLNPEKTIWGYFSLGIEFAAIFGFILWLGVFSDKSFSSTPLYTLISALIGFAIGITHIIRRTSSR